ncbi:MAG TPA: AraC family transcriptional regulator [Thermoanaerobaculia bacterium]|jgi:AraC-like DNA-binding protein|nr:AraC family transcriptional regulator [Thermoanaerobaculia bacterium]
MRREATAVIERPSSEMWPGTTVLRGRGTMYAARGPADAVSLKAVTAGSATWSAHGRRFVLTERMHLLLNAGEYSVEIDTPSEESATLCVFFERGFLEDIASHALDDEVQTREWQECIEPWNARVWPLLARLDQSSASEDLVIAIGESLVPWRRALPSSARGELHKRLLRGRDYMLSSLSERVVLRDAARAAFLSPYHFHRAFRETFGAPPHRYLAERRLERAAHLLRTTNRPANEISLECGFESAPSFTNAFRKRFGAPPARWRSHEETRRSASVGRVQPGIVRSRRVDESSSRQDGDLDD